MLSVNVQKTINNSIIDAKFNVNKGITALYGPSGAGKTTIINMIAGLLNPDNGKIKLSEKTIFNFKKNINLKPEQRRIGYIFQDPRLFPHLNVIKNLKYGMNYVPKTQRIIEFDSIVDLLGIKNLLDRKIINLSGGEKQRISIGRALLTSPDLLLMDEPLSSLDDSRRHDILPFLSNLCKNLDIPIIYVSHNIQEILYLAETLIVIGNGKTRAVGSVEETLSRKDLRIWTGSHDASTVFLATVKDSRSNGLTCLSFKGGQINVSNGPEIGTAVRVRVQALNVSISLTKPENISILNICYGTITFIEDGEYQVDVEIDIGIKLWSRITKYSALKLNLKTGMKVYALIKAVAIEGERHIPLIDN